MNLIFLGPPGSGKGTQAKLLADKYQLKHISSGAMLRAESQKDTQRAKNIKKLMNQGDLLPFDIVLEVIDDQLLDASHGFILDGTPRNLDQAKKMEEFFTNKGINIDHVVIFDLSDNEGQKRMLTRAKKEHRSDDTPETIKHRYQVYHQETQPIIDFYEQSSQTITVDADPDIDTIFKDLEQKLNLGQSQN